MPAVSAVNLNLTINAAATYAPTGVISAYSIPANLAFQGIAFINANGAALDIDLAAWGNVTLTATSQLVDFSALVDPGGVTQNWTNGRVRFFGVQVITQTAGDILEVYSDATNGVAWLPPVANYLPIPAYMGTLILLDAYSNGSAIGNVITSSHKRLDFNSGANTVNFAWMALGSSVA